MPRSLRISSHGPTAKDCDYTKGRYYLSTLLLGKEDSFFAGKLIDMLAQILAANLCSTLGTLGEVFMLHVLLKQYFSDIYIILVIWLCLALLLLYSCDHIIFSRFFQIFWSFLCYTLC